MKMKKKNKLNDSGNNINRSFDTYVGMHVRKTPVLSTQKCEHVYRFVLAIYENFEDLRDDYVLTQFKIIILQL